MDKKQIIGSNTAKNGFQNERDIADKFNMWRFDEDAQVWLGVMNYDLSQIEKVEAVILSNQHKADIQVKIYFLAKNTFETENISIKLVSNLQGFNQIDKRWVAKYIDMWQIPPNIAQQLKKFTGEVMAKIPGQRDSRRLFLNELPTKDQTKIVKFFEKNKITILTDLLKGQGSLAADWLMVAQKDNRQQKWILKPIKVVLNFFATGQVAITSKGSLKIGKITMQRKGGDAGRKTAQMLQFKLNPAQLFELES